MRIDKNTTIRLGDRNIVKIKIGDSVIWQKTTEPDYLYIENTYAGGNTISVKQTLTGSPDSSTYAKTLQYSKDKTNWSTITLSSTTHNINLNQGERVYLRGNEGVLNYYANDGAIQAITNILGTQTHTIGGNINTLVNYITPNELTLTKGVFAELFQNNTTITSAENLTLPPSSDDSLPTFAYYLMFSGCSALITPPSEIPATKQGHASCGKMFLDCIQLKTPPALKSTILGSYCFTLIFKNCTSLISAPELPALTLTSNCYQAAFEGCTSLVNPPALPATEMKPNCYRNLFYGCTSLVNAPELPATTLAEGCYRSLFNGCTSLVTAPDLLAPTLVSYCYAYLFNACTSLNSVKCTATSGVGSNNSTAEWLWNVSPTGTFTKESGVTWETGVSGIPSGWTVNSYGTDYLYIQNTYAGENTITFTTTQSGTPASGTYATSVECSKDKLTWTTLSLAPGVNNTISLNQGEKLYFRNDSGYFNYTGNSNNYYTSITGSKSHKLGGNINTLINYTDLSNVSLSQGCFNRMFLNDIELVDASDLELPSTTLSPNCYQSAFEGCTSLKVAPQLPATVLANYCYQALFKGCSALTTPPTVIPAETAPYMCSHRMFNDCVSLKSAPELSPTTLGSGAYQYMFMGCSNLQTAPSELPAETLELNSYYEMFRGCSQLTTAPTIKAKTFAKNSCRGMFVSCSKLNNVTVYANDISATDCTSSWLSGVASTGTFRNLGSATYVKDSVSGIPSGWTEVKK